MECPLMSKVRTSALCVPNFHPAVEASMHGVLAVAIILEGGAAHHAKRSPHAQVHAAQPMLHIVCVF